MTRQAQFHAITFGYKVEAAAFIAALSRYLVSPAGAHYRAAHPHVEVRAFADSLDQVTVYLSDAALGAARTAFSPVVGDVARGAVPPIGCLVVIRAGKLCAFGLEEAEGRLAGA